MTERTHFKTSNINAKQQIGFSNETGFKIPQDFIRDSISFDNRTTFDKISSDVTVVKDVIRSTVNSRSLIENANNILIVCKGKSNDATGAAVALALYVKQKYQKNPELIYLSDDMSSDSVDLIDSISQELRDLYSIKPELEKVILKIELDYKETQIESCEWYKDEENEKLVFEIKPIHKGFGTKRIKFREEGLDFDLIITIGVHSLEDVGEVYRANEHYFKSVDILNFDISNENLKYGKVNIIDESTTFLTKVVFDQFIDWKFVPDIYISRCLLIGLSDK